MWTGTIWTLGSGMGFGGKYILLAEAKMLMILYLHLEEFQVLHYVTAYDHLLWVVITCPKACMKIGRELSLLCLCFWDNCGLNMFHLTNPMPIPPVTWSTCSTVWLAKKTGTVSESMGKESPSQLSGLLNINILIREGEKFLGMGIQEY